MQCGAEFGIQAAWYARISEIIYTSTILIVLMQLLGMPCLTACILIDNNKYGW